VTTIQLAAAGCNRLAVLYYYGRGVERGADTAKSMFKKACDSPAEPE
jgi:TPR repeat protein